MTPVAVGLAAGAVQRREGFAVPCGCSGCSKSGRRRPKWQPKQLLRPVRPRACSNPAFADRVEDVPNERSRGFAPTLSERRPTHDRPLAPRRRDAGSEPGAQAVLKPRLAHIPLLPDRLGDSWGTGSAAANALATVRRDRVEASEADLTRATAPTPRPVTAPFGCGHVWGGSQVWRGQVCGGQAGATAALRCRSLCRPITIQARGSAHRPVVACRGAYPLAYAASYRLERSAG
jgi:hypothetical protein